MYVKYIVDTSSEILSRWKTVHLHGGSGRLSGVTTRNAVFNINILERNNRIGNIIIICVTIKYLKGAVRIVTYPGVVSLMTDPPKQMHNLRGQQHN